MKKELITLKKYYSCNKMENLIVCDSYFSEMVHISQNK